MSGTPPYVELHAHCAYSLLDGASTPEELVVRAGELGHTALTLTDHDSLAGAMELAMAARDSTVGEHPVRSIFGAEVTVEAPAGAQSESYRHLTLLVRDLAGWRNLCRLLTRAHAHTRDTPDRRAGQPSVSLERVLEHAGGLVCLTGCHEHGVEDEPTARRLLDAFGPQRLRVELQRPYAASDLKHNRTRERLARRLGVPTVATGDVHAHTKMRALLQDAFTAIRHGQTLDASEVQLRPNDTHVLATPAGMAARFEEYEGAAAESVRLAETLTFDLGSDLGYRYPGSEDESATRRLAEICQAEFARRYTPDYPRREEAARRLAEELALIDTLGFSGFFNLHYEVLQVAREVAIEVRGPDTVRSLLEPGRGRGSSVSSVVCYLAGLSHIDPIAAELAIGRFLHSELTSLPDIDIDLPRDIRDRLLPRLPEHFGADRVALVGMYPTFKPKAAIRELGKALGLPAAELDRVAKGSEGWGADGTVAQDIRAALGTERLAHGRWRWLAKLAGEAHGLPRHLSQHPGGMVISTGPLIDCCPIVPSRMRGRQMLMWDKDSVADAGMIKLDLLGLPTLGAIERCVETIYKRRGVRVDLARIQLDDPGVYEELRTGKKKTSFGFSSRAQEAYAQMTQPHMFAELVIQDAIIRPGANGSGETRGYIKARQEQLRNPDFQPSYLHPSLEGPLRRTLGTVVFQDQVMEIGRSVAGFSAGQAEAMRRAMSRKRSAEAMDALYRQFADGARRTHPGITQTVIDRTWTKVRGFGQGFGFPEAHANAWALLGFQSGWLDRYFPPEYLLSLLNEQPLGFYAPDTLIHDAAHRGIKTLPPDVVHSEEECTLTDDETIQLGLCYIKGLHEEDIQRLIESRQADGPYRSLEDLAARGAVSHPTLAQLAWSGACDSLTGPGEQARRTALWQLGVTRPAKRGKDGDQLGLELPLGEAPDLPSLTAWEAMLANYETTELSTDPQPIALLREQLTRAGAVAIAGLAKIAHGRRVKVGGLVAARQRPETAKGITFLLLEDETGLLNTIVYLELYEQERQLVRSRALLLVEGELQRREHDGGAINLVAMSIAPLNNEDGRPARVKRLPTGEQTSLGGDDFGQVAPAVMSFAQGRRR
jgi:error-prone DNA polymerase